MCHSYNMGHVYLGRCVWEIGKGACVWVDELVCAYYMWSGGGSGSPVLWEGGW